MGCSDATIPDQRLSSVEVNHNSDTVVVRTVLTVEQNNELQRHLEKEVSSLLSDIFYVPLSNNNGNKVGSVSIELIDEDPSSHVAEGVDGMDGLTSKSHFDITGKAFSQSVQLTIGPLLEDLSFIYGAKIEVDDDVSSISQGSVIKTKNEISLESHSSAYLPLPDDLVESESADDGTTSVKYVSYDGLANWIHAHSSQRTRNNGHIAWILFIPSRDNTPLIIRDESSGGQGESIVLISHTVDGWETQNANPNGMCIVNLPTFSEYVGSNANKSPDMGQIHTHYKDTISQSLVYLAGYIRALHGLPSSASQMHVDHFTSSSSVKYHGDDGRGKLSYWELESIARSQYYSSLELVFSETDALMAVMHQHGSTLALPRGVAYKLNNATHLLRQSISLVERGFPTVYASSLLHGSLRYLESVQNDHQFMELPYFATDHYLAVFSPLVLPLLLPMVVGLIREVKRFRDLQKKGRPQL
ncbi:hypothetical protein ACHAXR_004283 [Thalassiosira sp. AJA248-18]